MHNAFNALVRSGDLTTVESIEVPARAERRLPTPAAFEEGPVGEWLRSKLGEDGTLWRHQSLALETIARGLNVVIATGTASGKSLIFQMAAVQALTQTNDRTLVLYPLKALLN